MGAASRPYRRAEKQTHIHACMHACNTLVIIFIIRQGIYSEEDVEKLKPPSKIQPYPPIHLLGGGATFHVASRDTSLRCLVS